MASMVLRVKKPGTTINAWPDSRPLFKKCIEEKTATRKIARRIHGPADSPKDWICVVTSLTVADAQNEDIVPMVAEMTTKSIAFSE